MSKENKNNKSNYRFAPDNNNDDNTDTSFSNLPPSSLSARINLNQNQDLLVRNNNNNNDNNSGDTYIRQQLNNNSNQSENTDTSNSISPNSSSPSIQNRSLDPLSSPTNPIVSSLHHKTFVVSLTLPNLTPFL